MEVKGSEAQGRHRKVGSEGSVEQIPGRGRDGGMPWPFGFGGPWVGRARRSRHRGELEKCKPHGVPTCKRPAHRFLVETHLSNCRMPTRMYWECGRGGEVTLPLMPISSGISPSIFAVQADLNPR